MGAGEREVAHGEREGGERAIESGGRDRVRVESCLYVYEV